MPYLMNAWYVAAWAGELARGQLLARTYLDRPVVLFRDQAGRAAALADMCPHRFAPLSKGKVLEGVVQCGYHGLRFARTGACVFSPQTPDRPPPNAKVRSYPVLERQTLVWIWLGDPARADPALAPDLPIFDDPEVTPVVGHSCIPGHYQLVIDNLMDLSHPEFIHAGSLGSPANSTANYEVQGDGGRVVHSNRWFDEGPIPPAFEQQYPSGGKPVAHWANMRWEAPANLVLNVGVTGVGLPREAGFNAWSGHLLTPETGEATHYFWSSVRRRPLSDQERTASEKMLRSIFEGEDSPMIAAVHARMAGADFWDLRPVMLPGDAGGVRVRQALEALIDAEARELAA